ncbi:hypothetical protein VNO78_06962 [Psophocarpus tetragonolobus]|uniref:Uncharacterized protein n=1 Tax=Psophocarpus tetragonolobus TaxID=3891 RepID=A0AAN9XS56_PSOTE
MRVNIPKYKGVIVKKGNDLIQQEAARGLNKHREDKRSKVDMQGEGKRKWSYVEVIVMGKQRMKKEWKPKEKNKNNDGELNGRSSVGSHEGCNDWLLGLEKEDIEVEVSKEEDIQSNNDENVGLKAQKVKKAFPDYPSYLNVKHSRRGGYQQQYGGGVSGLKNKEGLVEIEQSVQRANDIALIVISNEPSPALGDAKVDPVLQPEGTTPHLDPCVSRCIAVEGLQHLEKSHLS